MQNHFCYSDWVENWSKSKLSNQMQSNREICLIEMDLLDYSISDQEYEAESVEIAQNELRKLYNC